MNFQKELISWYLQNKRELPWRNTIDPYVIWLSEIILQQTRVEQGKPYFIKFLEAFPTVTHFANASEDQVLKLWQGLGYYSRGRNMLVTAKQVVTAYEGKFPTRYDDLISLKGIGEYTAAAISSFAANETRAVLDGNVFRVLARYFGIEEPINSTIGKKIFSKLANELIEGQQASIYNQAIMEFGALQCKPKSPLCQNCPLQIDCFASNHNQVDLLPIKLKTVKIKTRWFNYFIVRENENILIQQRTSGDVWQQLYDFPLIETLADPQEDLPTFIRSVKDRFGPDSKIRSLSQKKHVLTHQIIYVHFFALDNYMINFNQLSGIKLVSLLQFKELPHPKVIEEFATRYLEI